MSTTFEKKGAAGQLVGVGVGPGDPRNLTLRALDTLKAADLVIAPASAPQLQGRAEGIVKQVLPEIHFQRLVFDMTAGETGMQARSRGAREAAGSLLEPLRKGKNVAFITLGDPNVFSTFSLVAREVTRLAPDVKISTIPGIMAFQEVASMGRLNLLDESEKLFLVTAFKGMSDVEESITHGNATVIIYKGGRHIGEIKEALRNAGRLEGAVVGELLGLEGEHISTLESVTVPEISYLATVIAPPLRGAQTDTSNNPS